MKTLRLLLLCMLMADVVPAQQIWPVLTREMKPWTRWWWIGSAVNEKDLLSSLQTYQKAGFGGVEIAPIYGAQGYEQQYISYLSPRWVNMLDYTVAIATRLNMGVDLTTGTGWPFGGPQITKEYAASKMLIRQFKPGDEIPAENLQAVTGTTDIYALYNDKTKQVVKRAAPGGEGFTLDHYSLEALQVYLHRFDTALHRVSHGVRAFYNDSYEVYGADWSAKFFETFEQNRGYDLKPYIRMLATDTATLSGRIKSDYRETLSEMLLNNFTKPWTQWSHQYKSVSKNQAHGSPGNLLDLYAAVDIPECETYGSTYFPIPGLRRDSADIRNVDPDPVMLKFASSAAHVTGHPLVSCETFTWLTEHFKTSLSQCKPEVEQAFLAGVNHVFFHGTTFSPESVAWPGWLFYASVNFVPSNSWWPHLSGLTGYISRVQSILQSSKPDNELLVYWPIYDVWNQPKGKDISFKVHDIDEWLYPSAFYKQVKGLQKAGYSLDFVSDHLLDKVIADNEYKVLIIPSATMMPLSTLQKIKTLAENGGTVLFESLPEDVPGLSQLEERRKQFNELLSAIPFDENGIAKVGKGKIILAPDVQQGLEQQHIIREKLTDVGLKFIRLRSGADTYYYLVNHTAQKIDQSIPLNNSFADVLILDPLTGNYGKAITDKEGVKVQLLPGESLILKARHQAVPVVKNWVYTDQVRSTIKLEGNWSLTFPAGGPSRPAPRQLGAPVLWNTLPDTALQSFSGTGSYQLTFLLPDVTGKEYVLDLGEIHESARVWINGKNAGISWSIPYKLRVKQFLKKGRNEITIEVTNLMANRMRYMDQHHIPWRRYHEINFVNINYGNFDASDWAVQPSGLAGPVTISVY